MKEILLAPMGGLVHQRMSLALVLVKQRQNFAYVCIIIVIMVICLLMEKKFISWELVIQMLTLKLNFVKEHI